MRLHNDSPTISSSLFFFIFFFFVIQARRNKSEWQEDCTNVK